MCFFCFFVYVAEGSLSVGASVLASSIGFVSAAVAIVKPIHTNIANTAMHAMKTGIRTAYNLTVSPVFASIFIPRTLAVNVEKLRGLRRLQQLLCILQLLIRQLLCLYSFCFSHRLSRLGFVKTG
jgi:hypothetical protein